MEEYPLTVPSRSAVRVRVPAKINLHLGVGPLRDDNFHDLATVFHAVSLYDELTLECGPPGIRLILESPDENVPTDERNLAVRALKLLAEHANIEPAVTVRLRKGIPVAGGMAGGSADAAAALIAGDALWHLATPPEKLHELAAQLGSDVPFALHGGDALGTGRGEHLTPLTHPYQRHWVFVTAHEGLSTPAVYAQSDRLRKTTEASDPAAVIKALDEPDPQALADALCNDLQEATLNLRPELHEVINAGEAAGALKGIVSGSGPTCAFLVRDAEHARRVAENLKNYPTTTAFGSVDGAQLVTN
ncbi:4-(cytidine 5'-diphospho)-2-C-methyl-D-erythritol kinase [Cryptosporangium sp. NPDC048952]|uniref:4-(cytidine 5'-diphospho)-2-C-methyl-D-erythritol kinase n=1 Tax=Cryptosporangium sp. NPDC048952 TaxID=3363961 RepID=UPI00371C1C2D